MTSRPVISDKTIEKLQEWMENNPEKGISSNAGAIEYIINEYLKEEDTLDSITERLDRLEEKMED